MKFSQASGENLPFLNTHSHTDLAIESISPENGSKEVLFREYEENGYTLFEMEVTGEKGEAQSKRKKGRYLSLSAPEMKHPETADRDKISDTLKNIILDFIEYEKISISRETRILIAGLGNRAITADAIGPLTADKILATAHLNKESASFKALGAPNISVISPGVCADTGIEAAKAVCALSDTVSAELIIAIDALCAKNTDRLCTTIQISNSGIHPGSGIGNRRMALTREILGIPIIAIGIPTVISAKTLICDALSHAALSSVGSELEDILQKNNSFFVSHGESDSLIALTSDIISSAIEKALIPSIFLS